MAENQVNLGVKAGLYVDGFNLYHAINILGEPWLKWLDLRRLGERIAAKHAATLERTVFCTAVPGHIPEPARERHLLYNAALRANGVEVIPGHYIYNQDEQKYSEKQSDINVALELIADAEDNRVQVAILLSADSDQAATGRVFKARHPDKKLVAVAPPGKSVPQKLIPYSDDHFVLTKMQIDEAAFEQIVAGKTRPITRPAAYDPPGWWVHPNDRP